MVIVWPVMLRASGVIRYSTAAATSSTVMNAFFGIGAEHDALNDLIFGNAACAGLIGDLRVHQRRADVSGADGVAGNVRARGFQGQHLG